MTRHPKALCVTMLILLAAWAPSGPTYDLSWHSIDGGGGLSSGGAFDLLGAIGQHDASGPMTGGGFSLSGGFLAGGATQCPADISGGDGMVDISDLLDLLAAWGTPAADITGDGTTDIDDLLDLLAAWGACP